MPAMIDLTGKSFGRLTVLKREGTNELKRPTWLCKCTCGTVKVVDGQNLRNGSSKSCGCFNLEQKRLICVKRNVKHGESPRGEPKSKEYGIWANMRSRCRNPNTEGFKKYGARGIYVHPDWESFEQFLKDMGRVPSKDHTIDRIDPYGPYSKDNCRWATMKEQQNNRTNNRLITCNGETKTLMQWSEFTGIPRKTIHNRIARGWEVDRALGFKP